jgi:SAM-dependent methyltransferase
MPDLEIEHGNLDVRFPSQDEALEQDEEWCEVEEDGEVRRIRFHDYAEIYNVPGLYERIFYDALKCSSPQSVVGLLAEQLRAGELLRVFDVGAGNGMVAEQLDMIGTEFIVGVDIIPEAAEAAERDRPGLYDEYVVADLNDPKSGAAERLQRQRLNALTCVAALGFGDIPPEVFCEALRQVETPSLVVYTIKDAFLGEKDESGFSDLVERLEREGSLVTITTERYQHRLNWAGEPLHYVAVLAEKRRQI